MRALAFEKGGGGDKDCNCQKPALLALLFNK